MKEHRGRETTSSTRAGEADAVSPGKQTLTSGLQLKEDAERAPGLRRLQLRSSAGGGAGSPEQVQHAAAAGIRGAGGSLPHLDRIQASFGSQHDLSSVVAHVGGPAAEAAGDIGASAYASGNHVAFAQTPDLHTAAHEAAHVVQQKQGVQLYGGVGAAGDSYEQHADAVADRVVAGRSAADLLGAGPSGAGAHTAVQRNGNPQGTETHSATVGSGKVTARENDYDPSDKTTTNFSLEYAGGDADKAHWLQFVNFTMWADTPGGKVYYTGSVDTSSGNLPFSTDKVTNWAIDGGSASDPFYEATGSNVREPGKKTKIFDWPGGSSIEPFAAKLIKDKAPDATKVTFVGAFDTYLVQADKSTYHVTWTATTDYDPKTKKSAAIAYHTGAAGAVAALPAAFKKILDAKYAGNKIT